MWLQSLGETDALLEGIPNAKVEHLSAQARARDASVLRDFGPQRRRAILVCLLHRSKFACRDNLSEMLVKIMAKVHKSGKEALEQLHREKRATHRAPDGGLRESPRQRPPLQGRRCGFRHEGAPGAGRGRRTGSPARSIRLALRPQGRQLPAAAGQVLQNTARHTVQGGPLVGVTPDDRGSLAHGRSNLRAGERPDGLAQRVYARGAGPLARLREVARPRRGRDERQAGPGEEEAGDLRVLLSSRRTKDRRRVRGRLREVCRLLRAVPLLGGVRAARRKTPPGAGSQTHTRRLHPATEGDARANSGRGRQLLPGQLQRRHHPGGRTGLEEDRGQEADPLDQDAGIPDSGEDARAQPDRCPVLWRALYELEQALRAALGLGAQAGGHGSATSSPLSVTAPTWVQCRPPATPGAW